MKFKNDMIILGMLLTLAACGSRSGFMGVRSTPNEFKVYQNESLDVPPQDAKTALPKPGQSTKPNASNPQSQVQSALIQETGR